MAAAGVPWLGEASYPENSLIFGMDANACSNSRRAMRIQCPEIGHGVYTTMMLWNSEVEFVAWQGSTHPVEDIGGHEQCPLKPREKKLAWRPASNSVGAM